MIHTILAWFPAALWAAVLFFLSSQRQLPGASFLTINDKVAHFLAYAVLGAALAWGRYRTRRGPRGPVAGALSSLPFLLILGALFAASDEWHQSFVPGRDPSVWDFTADMLGIVVGLWVVGRWALRMAPRRRELGGGRSGERVPSAGGARLSRREACGGSLSQRGPVRPVPFSTRPRWTASDSPSDGPRSPFLVLQWD